MLNIKYLNVYLRPTLSMAFIKNIMPIYIIVNVLYKNNQLVFTTILIYKKLCLECTHTVQTHKNKLPLDH